MTHHGLARRLALVSVLAAAACDDDDDPPPLASATIGVDGGTMAVPDGGPSLTVPAGALAQDVGFRIDPGQISIVPGYVDVGPAYAFSPPSTTFAMPATIVLPFDPTRVPDPAMTSDLLIGLRTATGPVVSLVPTAIDPMLGTATFTTTELGTFWVGAPDVVSPSALFPLGNGDSYVFDTGTVLTVARTTTEPNFDPAEVAKLTFTRIGLTDGLYLDDAGADLALRGSFLVPSYQIRYDTPALLIADRDPIGSVRVVLATYLGFSPFGTSLVGFTGLEQLRTELVRRETVWTEVGTFDTVVVRIDSLWTETPGGQGAGSIQMWLANGVGPVQLLFDDGAFERLRSATVGGMPVTGG